MNAADFKIVPKIKDGEHFVQMRYNGDIIFEYEGWPTMLTLINKMKDFATHFEKQGKGDE